MRKVTINSRLEPVKIVMHSLGSGFLKTAVCEKKLPSGTYILPMVYEEKEIVSLHYGWNGRPRRL